MKEPLLLPFLALAAGIIVSHASYIPAVPGRPGTGCISACYSCSPGGARSAGPSWTCGLLAAASAGAWLDAYHRPGPAPQLDTPDTTPVILAGCVVEPSEVLEDHETFTLELEPGARARVNLYRREGRKPYAFRYGQNVEVEAKIRTPHNFNNPGSFDNAGYLARQKSSGSRPPAPGLRDGQEGTLRVRLLALVYMPATPRTAPYRRALCGGPATPSTTPA